MTGRLSTPSQSFENHLAKRFTLCWCLQSYGKLFLRSYQWDQGRSPSCTLRYAERFPSPTLEMLVLRKGQQLPWHWNTFLLQCPLLLCCWSSRAGCWHSSGQEQVHGPMGSAVRVSLCSSSYTSSQGWFPGWDFILRCGAAWDIRGRAQELCEDKSPSQNTGGCQNPVLLIQWVIAVS